MSVAAASFGFLMLWSMWPEQARVALAPSSMAQSDGPSDPFAESTLTPPIASNFDLDRNALLSKPVTLRCDDVPLATAFASIAEQVGVAIHLQRKALEDVNIPPDTPITLDVKEVQLRSVLALICDQHGLDWLERENALLITSFDAAREQTQTRIYDIGELLALRRDVGQPEATSLERLIIQQVATNEWNEEGGQGTLSLLDQSLVVRQTPRVHDQISSFLSALKRQLLQDPKEQALAPMDVTPYPKVLRQLKLAMRKPLGEMEVTDAPLVDIVRLLSERAGVVIHLDQKALDDSSIPLDSPVSFSFKDATLHSVLDSLADHVGLMWAYRNEAILITPADRVAEYSKVRLYPVGDLVGLGLEQVDWDRMDRVRQVLLHSTPVHGPNMLRRVERVS